MSKDFWWLLYHQYKNDAGRTGYLPDVNAPAGEVTGEKTLDARYDETADEDLGDEGDYYPQLIGSDRNSHHRQVSIRARHRMVRSVWTGGCEMLLSDPGGGLAAPATPPRRGVRAPASPPSARRP